MMRLRELERYGIPDRLIDRWAERHGDTLLPAQSRAVRKGLLGSPGGGDSTPVRLLISAPTASGKSFCAEMAVARSLVRRQKAIVLFPLKALAEQKYRTFRDTFGDLGLKCIIATGDHPENDRAFAQGDYDVAVAIYEKLDLLLTTKLDVLRTIGLIVIDEIQTITEPGRGALLERLLTAVKASVYDVSLLGLSAVIGETESSAGQLAAWLEADLVEESSRPIDLLRGVVADGSFRYRSFNFGTEDTEIFDPPDPSAEPWEHLIDRVKQETGKTLVFLKSRRETVEAAVQLAGRVQWTPAESSRTALAEEEPSYLVRALRQALSRGCAFHNADLSSRQRRIVEEAFTAGDVRVVFATTTLAMGVDLPADTVYLETVKYSGGVYDNRPSLVPVSRAEFDNMTGRAGRPGHGDARPGRAIILAGSEFERDILWKNYIAPLQAERVNSVFDTLPLTEWVLSWIVSGMASTTAQLAELYGHTFAACTRTDYVPRFEAAVGLLSEKQCIEVRRDGTLAATSFGRAVTLGGLTTAQAAYLHQAACERFPDTDFGWLALVLGSPDWSLPAGLLSRFEAADRTPLRLLYQRFDHLVGEARILIGELPQGQDYTTLARLKALLILDQWRRMKPVQDLEEQFQMHLGQIAALGESAAHLLAGLGRLLGVLDPESAPSDRLRRLAFSVRFGLDVSLLSLHGRLRRILSRADFIALHRAGTLVLRDLCDRPPEDVASILGVSINNRKICELQDLLKQEVDMQQASTATAQSLRTGLGPSIRPSSIEIDGTCERERYLVVIDGYSVWLTGKSFKYFLKLAWARSHRDTGWIYKEDIEVGFNQARYLYRMKNEINDSLAAAWSSVENNRLGYYRLNADPGSIQINVDTLRDHPDYEVRSLIRGEEQHAVN